MGFAQLSPSCGRSRLVGCGELGEPHRCVTAGAPVARASAREVARDSSNTPVQVGAFSTAMGATAGASSAHEASAPRLRRGGFPGLKSGLRRGSVKWAHTTDPQPATTMGFAQLSPSYGRSGTVGCGELGEPHQCVTAGAPVAREAARDSSNTPVRVGAVSTAMGATAGASSAREASAPRLRRGGLPGLKSGLRRGSVKWVHTTDP
jgi:hypothetical protein